MNTDPNVIGYWCRVRDLRLEHALGVEQLSGVLDSEEAQKEFHCGWQQADRELTEERMAQLFEDLIEAVR